ncbi:MAG TPA: hypothetical protein ENK19_10470 [Acidobacteria bacterium]|nr:hypothetical protein [Acidobacteriota bacterium]
MPDPSRHFFDLSGVASLSRSLRHGGPVTTVAGAAPPAPVPPPEASPAAPAALPGFERPQVEYAEELWHALLEWIRRGLDAAGVFALDGHGFSIAASGEPTAVPAEVLMASFTSVAQLLEAYLSGDRPLSELLIAAEQEPAVTVLSVPWGEERIYLGVYGGRMPSGEDLNLMRTTIVAELASFSAARTGERKETAS